FLLLSTLRPPPSHLLPYTTLFRSPLVSARLRPRLLQQRHRRWRRRGARPHAQDARLRAPAPHSQRKPPRRARFVLPPPPFPCMRSEEHTSELQSRENLVCRLLLEK